MTQTGVKLRDRLTPDKKGLFENSILTHVETLYEKYPQPKCFTSHGIKHYKRVEARLNEIIPESIKSDLKEAEIFRLLSGVWFHDVGMLMGLFDGDNKRTDQEIREQHHKRSKDYVLDSENRLNFFDDPEKDHIAKLCLYHRMSEDISSLPSSERVGDDYIRLRLLAACLRLADALDLDSRRIQPPEELRSCIRYGMPIDQWIFWLKHAIVWGLDVQHEQHRIELHLRVPQKKENLKNIDFTLLSNLLLDNVKAELKSVKDVFGEYKIPLIDVSLRSKPDGTPGPDIMPRVERERLWQLVVAVANINLPRWPNAGRVVDIVLETILAMLDGLEPTEISDEIEKLLKWSVKTKQGYYGLYKIYEDITAIIRQTDDVSQLRQNITRYISDFRRDANDQLKLLSEKGEPLVIDGDSILLFGYSNCVLSVLKRAWKKGIKNVKIYVAESRNKSVFTEANEIEYNDGIAVANEAKKIGFERVYLFSDASLGHYIDSKMINKVLLGANGIDLDGSAIHSIGHLTVALVAHHFSIPVYIFAESYKVLNKKVTEILKEIEEATGSEIAENWLGGGITNMAGIQVLKPTSDMIPSNFLTSIVTDKGILVPNQLRTFYEERKK